MFKADLKNKNVTINQKDLKNPEEIPKRGLCGLWQTKKTKGYPEAS